MDLPTPSIPAPAPSPGEPHFPATPSRLSRRQFLQATGLAGGGLMLAIALPPGGRRALAAEAGAAAKPRVFPPAAFIQIAADDRVTVLINKLEFGQGVFTSMAMLLAEELDCAWAKVSARHAPAAPVYAHPEFGIQMTGGSTSIASSYLQFRTIGAMARYTLVQAAAERWQVPAAGLATREGRVIETGGRRRQARYGELAEAAQQVPLPESVALKSTPQSLKLIGKPTRRIDAREKVDGSAVFGIDQQLPGLKVAVLARPPVFGARVAAFDRDAARAVKGVLGVLEVPVDRGGSGVAVIAESFWPARSGREALKPNWTLPAERVGSDALRAKFLELSGRPGLPARAAEGAAEAIDRSARRIEAVFEFPYLAHAAMEPLNVTVDLHDDRCTLYLGSQFQTVDQALAAKAAGLPPERVEIVTTFAGGGFGRRANPAADVAVEGVAVARAMKQAGIAGPVKVIWTREDDMRGGYYRPMHVHRVVVGLDGRGRPTGWRHTIVGQSILKGTSFEPFLVKDGIDGTTVEGVTDTPYAIPRMAVDVHHPELNVPVLWWRSVGHSHTAFVMETLVDELAVAAAEDPIAYRLQLLDPRHVRVRGVLERIRAVSGWGKPAPAGRARGVAVHESFGSVCAHVAEVSVDRGQIRVHRVTSVLDCGTAVNPLTIEAQVQSAMVYGLSAALHGRITLKDGQVEQGNFADYPILRIDEMPEMRVHVMPSTAAPTGVGEPGTPPIAPAVANAVFALTGQRLRSLPFTLPA